MESKGRHETSARPGLIEDENNIGTQQIEDVQQDSGVMDVLGVVVVENWARPVWERLPLREIDGEMMNAEVSGG